jgi:hypothetical protein
MKRLMLAVTAVALGACATTGTGAGSPPSESADRMRVTNSIPFDLAVCSPRSLQLEAPSEELIQGALLSLWPAFQECLVDPKAADGAPLEVKVKATVGAEVSHEVLGTGLSASGKECLIAAVKKLEFKPVQPPAKAVSGEMPVQPGGKPVALGVNPPSDVVGAIRLAQPSFCSCYAELGTRPPPTLKAELTLAKGKPVEVVMEPNEVPAVSACVVSRLKSMTLPEADAHFPYAFLLKNSYSAGVTPDAVPELQFQQFDGLIAQRTADVLLAVAPRTRAAFAYDAAVTRYKTTKPEKAWTLIPELKTKCAALLAADDGWVASLKELATVYQSALKLIQAERLKDAAWGPLEEAITQRMRPPTEELSRAEGARKSDEGICPKSK